MRCSRTSIFSACLAFSMSVSAMTVEQRRDYLDWMRTNLPAVPSWNDWQQKTGELPPDFDGLPRANFLPDPFQFFDGRRVNLPADWPARRAEIRQLFEKWDIGLIPPKPKLDNIAPLGETRGTGYVTRNVRLEFGPGQKATAQVTVTIPDGDGPFPVLIGNGWASALIRRGYIACSFNDSVDQRSNLPELYPDFDFATMGQRAWTAQLVVDYLFTLPQVDKSRIAITGYSRGGKMATIAAALDDRIAAVIAGSTGVGGVLPWRLSGERGMGEGIETTTRMFPLWFAPQLRFFSGHEDRLPVDANLLVALIAPRACLMEYGLNDEVSNVWGDEQCYNSALKVYQALGQPGRLGLLRVPGFHGANDQEACLDWLDIQFGRSRRKWDNHLLFTWDFGQWVKDSGEKVVLSRFPRRAALDLLKTAGGTIAATNDWEAKAPDIRKSVEWMLGDAPTRMPAGGGRGFGGRGFAGRGGPPPGPTALARGGRGNPGQLAPDVPTWVIARNSQEFGWLGPEKDQTDSRRIRFGYNVTGDLYFPSNTPPNTKLPAVIWLHGYSYPLGYMWVYRRDLHPILALVKAGYAVLAFDQCGFGSRMNEAGPFYDRYPHWSQLGRMVEDTRAAIDALEKDSLVDPRRIYLFGYTLGGMVALHTAAVDPRVKGVVSISGFTPMRTDTADSGTGGIARLSQERPLLPRLGFFIGHEAQIPYDYDELLAAIAPRPVLVVQPQMDCDATPADVRRSVEAARKVYALYRASDMLAMDEPMDYQRLPTATQDRIVAWMKQHLKGNP
jgi:dienelactone hydrolase